MNGFTEYELKQRDLIRDLIASGDYARAREVSHGFLQNKQRRVKRRALLNTVRHWVTAMNEGGKHG